jgi:hypothetical protein
MVLAAFLNLAKVIFFVGWSVRKLARDFRETVTFGRARNRPRLPPPLPSIQPPPVIAGSPLS